VLAVLNTHETKVQNGVTAAENCVYVVVVGAELCGEGVKMLLPEIWRAVHGMLV